jgi:hypothetical protein
MIWNYCDLVRRLVAEIPNISDEAHQKQQTALVVLMSVTVVEAFTNVFFRVVVSETEFQQHLQRIEKDLKSNKGLDRKIKEWPEAIFGKRFDWNSGIGKDFMTLKKKRNQLIHFTSSHSTLNVGGMTIQGTADTSVFDDLDLNDAEFALQTAEDTIQELLRFRGLGEDKLPWAMQLWTGKVIEPK